jgi:fucose 4-O-acetylase-like acetyltransferase
MTSSNREYLPFIDWMKALGIVLIVVGHVAARPINGLTPPIYPKQLGVAFFIFVLGFSLARERRPAPQVLFNRAFEVYLVGIPIAILLTLVTFFQRGTLALSNYLPFMLGANVLFNNFPANPTTWYIGTYVHILLLWAFLVRSRRLRPWMLAVSLPAEILVRAFLIRAAGDYVAYMLASNWVSVFLLGTLCGQNRTNAVTVATVKSRFIIPASVLAVMAVGWPFVMDRTVVGRSFPFMRLSIGTPGVDSILTSACVSGLYVMFAWLLFLVARNVPTPSWVRLLARNTLIVFIGHMPVFYGLEGLLSRSIPGYAPRAAMEVLICLPGLALLSEGIWHLVQPRDVRDKVAAWLFRAPRAAS